MTLLADFEDFVTDHRPHDTLTGDTGEVTPNGYRLDVACPCGVTSSGGSLLKRRPRISRCWRG